MADEKVLVNDGPVLVVLAAGMGSRFGGLKQIKEVDDRGHALMEYAIYDAIKVGFSEVLFIIREDFAEEFKEKIGNRVAERIKVTYVYQALTSLPEGMEIPEGRVKPWGTTHAVWCARNELKGKKFATINSDDYYGQDAIVKAYEFLMKEEEDNIHGIIGFEIINTLTENGTVSRGVCAVDSDNMLIRIDERKEIKSEAGRGYYTLDGGITYHLIPLDAVASMNLWLFRPQFIDDISKTFEVRMRRGIMEKPLKFEETLSDAVQNIMDRKECKVSIVPTSEKWFGMTYKEDYDEVRENLARLTAEGIYPSENW